MLTPEEYFHERKLQQQIEECGWPLSQQLSTYYLAKQLSSSTSGDKLRHLRGQERF